MEIEQRKELGSFLKKKRAQIDPGSWDICSQGHRRTPGLRREEVAKLAEVSTTWYTWLEQGRPITPSKEALKAIGRVLKLNPLESQYIHQLVEKKPVKTEEKIKSAPENIVKMMDHLSAPAILLGNKMNILHWNEPCNSIIADFDGLPETGKNWAYFIFCDPYVRRKLVNPELHLSRFVAELRDYLGNEVHRPWAMTLLNNLKARGEGFKEAWDNYQISDRTSLLFEIYVDGRPCSFETNVLVPVQYPKCRLIIFTPR